MGKILEGIRSPEDLRGMSDREIDILCEELRETIIKTVSDNGGHLASNLGVVELTVALCQAFDLPADRVIWDVGHQSYPYKLLTGRYDLFSTLRQEDGLSGFPNRAESKYDSFTAGHSSNSISLALGVSESNRILGRDHYVVAVIGDGALTGGLAYEGLNNAGRLKRNLIVIVNDNNMSISRNVGSIARYLTYIRTKPGYIKTKYSFEAALQKLPLIGTPVASLLRKLKDRIKRAFYRSTIFDDFGFTYYGPFDGHNVKELREALESAKLVQRPVLLHVRTYKGRGYKYAEQDPAIYHGLAGFDVSTGDTGHHSKTFSDVFGEHLCTLAEKDLRICAITAAMQVGTGLAAFKDRFPQRFFDVGIAEEHAVTFAGGLAAGGAVPVFAVYSSFLQRAYDELIHDVALQGSKVILAIDRAGVVGEDGMTHQGVFDAAFLQTVPGATVYSPASFEELQLQLTYLMEHATGLCAIRYPRGKELFLPEDFSATTDAFTACGDLNAELCIVTYGRMFSLAAEACERLQKRGIPVKILKLNRIIPIDGQAVALAAQSKKIFFFEEGICSGGIGEHFACLLEQQGYDGEYRLRAIENPFIPHAPMFRSLEKLGLSTAGIEQTVLEVSHEEKT